MLQSEEARAYFRQQMQVVEKNRGAIPLGKPEAKLPPSYFELYGEIGLKTLFLGMEQIIDSHVAYTLNRHLNPENAHNFVRQPDADFQEFYQIKALRTDLAENAKSVRGYYDCLRSAYNQAPAAWRRFIQGSPV